MRPGLLALAALAVVVALGAAALPASAAADMSMRAGPLEATVREDPFAIELTDLRSGEVLRTLRGPAPAPDDPQGRYGPLGFSFDLRVPVLNNAYLGYYVAGEVETVWFHATEVEQLVPSAGGMRVIAATTDPAHDLEITLERVRGGAIRVTSRALGPFGRLASVSGAAFERAGGERFLGLGERSNAVDQTGNEVFNWAEEGPFSSGDFEDQMRPLVPEFTFPTGPTATNFPIPWVITSRGLGFLIDQTHRSRFRFASERDDAWQAEAETNRFRFIVFAGPTPKRVLRRYTTFAGRQPEPRPWIFGPWFQATLEERPYEIADLWREEDVPVTVAQTYTHYLPCGAHVGREEAERERVAEHHARGYKITTYFNPHVCTSYQPVYDEFAARSLFVENALGEPYILSNPFTADEMISEVDFTNPEAERRFGELLDEALAAGYDGWMEDFGEYTPTDSHFDNGGNGLAMHNRYPVIYHRASYRHTRERRGRNLAAFVRSGFHGSQRFSRVVWGGDPTEDWSCADGLCAAVHQALSMGLSGVAYWGTDIGGFHAVVNDRTDDELNIRWLQAGFAFGVMRTQANGFSFADDRAERSQVWHPGVLPIWRRYAKLRTQLLPYIKAASQRYQRSGLPISRHLALAYPADRRAVRRQTEFMFGPDLLVAPVVTEGARERQLYLPRGRWVELWRGIQYRPGRGVLRPDAARTMRGGRTVTVEAPLSELPIFARAGTILPLLSADVDTLANLGEGRRTPVRHGADPIPGKRNPALVTLADRRWVMRLLSFPRGRSSAALGGGERVVSRERAGRRWVLRIRGTKRRRYNVRAALSTLRRPFRPCSVRIGGKPLAQTEWGYHHPRRTFRARVVARRARVVVRGC